MPHALFGFSRLHRVMTHETARRNPVVGNVCGSIIIRSALVEQLIPQLRQARSLGRGAMQVGDALSGALVKCIALALEPRHRRRVGVACPNVQLLTFLARLVGVEQAEVFIQTLVDRLGSCPAAACEHDKAACQTRTADNARIVHSHSHVQASVANLPIDGGAPSDAWSGLPWWSVAVH